MLSIVAIFARRSSPNFFLPSSVPFAKMIQRPDDFVRGIVCMEAFVNDINHR
jgi:hypothetical protein